MLLLQGARIRSLVGEAGSVAKKKGAEREALQAYLANNDVFDCVPQLPVPQLMAQHSEHLLVFTSLFLILNQRTN